MRSRFMVLACASLLLFAAPPAHAGIAPYARVSISAEQLKMGAVNEFLDANHDALVGYGVSSPDMDPVGLSYGPSGSAGLWLTRSLRVGATYSKGRSNNINHQHVPGIAFVAEDLDFRIEEVGGEVALRFERYAGFTIGGHMANATAKVVEGHTVQDGTGDLFMDAFAEKKTQTYGGFVGLDQRNQNGIVGYLYVGYQKRDFGSMPSRLVISDGVTTVNDTGNTLDTDYSGFYARAGIGFDFGH